MKAGWKYVKLGEVCDVQNGYAFDSSHFTSSKIGVPLIRIRDILRGYSETYTDEKYDQSYIVRKGDFLIGMDGDFNVGEWKSEDALLNQRVCRLVPSNKVNSRFIYYYLPQVLKDINDKTTYATVKHLSSKQVKQILVPAISLSEQGEIVAYLDKEFALIDALREKATLQLQAAKDLFQSALKQLLTPKQGWEEKKICSVGEVRIGPFGSLLHKSDYVLGGVPLINPMHIISGVIKADINYSVSLSKANELSAYRMRTKDIVLGRRGEMGRCAVVEDSQSGFLCGTGSIFFRPNPTIVNPYFLSLLLQSEEGVSKLSNVAGGATMQNLSSKAFGSILVFLPSLSEQEEIVRKLDALSEKCRQLEENYRQTITLCNDLKQAILRQVFE